MTNKNAKRTAVGVNTVFILDKIQINHHISSITL
jgi:hypothetical protein